jgi:diaminohydroxyphosphoribosylaminopyrimidine deaminase / 5-amino-6-(5-phosphoribosylamino)uracil reductase
METQDIAYMNRALELARRGLGLTSPNPMVGAVLVKDGDVIGEGFHQYDSLDHAEIVALKAAGESAPGATLYVTLDPCCTTGRTRPCTEAIAAAGVRRVVAAMQDPNREVSGRGFKRLRAAGIEVTVGLLEEQARRMNEAFARWARDGRPFITLKSALTLDGQLAMPQSGKHKSSTWITSDESRAEVHRMRHASDALLTGIGTVLADDPLLTDRSGLPRRRKLLRVVLDSSLRVPPESNLIKTADHDVLIVTTNPVNRAKAGKLESRGVEVISVTSRPGLDLHRVCLQLAKRGILSVILEGGSTLNGAALKTGIVDKLVLFYAPKVAGSLDVPFARMPGGKSCALSVLRDVTIRRFGPDFAVEGYLRDVYRNH